MEMQIFALKTTEVCPSLFIRLNPNWINWKNIAGPCHNTWASACVAASISWYYLESLFLCRVSCDLVQISHIEQVTETLNQITFISITNNFVIQFVKCDFPKNTQANISKRENNTSVSISVKTQWMLLFFCLCLIFCPFTSFPCSL